MHLFLALLSCSRVCKTCSKFIISLISEETSILEAKITIIKKFQDALSFLENEKRFFQSIQVVFMPLNNIRKLKAILEELNQLEDDQKINKRISIPLSNVVHVEQPVSQEKKDYLLATEIKAYFEISHYYHLVSLSIDDLAISLEIWIKAILPLLLQQHGIDREEWERVCLIGDADPKLEKELRADWKNFLTIFIKQGQINQKVLSLIEKGKERVKKLTNQ